MVKGALAQTQALKQSLDKVVSQWYLNPLVAGGVSPILANSTLESLSQSLDAVHEIQGSLSSVLEQMPETHCILAPLVCQITESFPRQWSFTPAAAVAATSGLELSLQGNEPVRDLVQEIHDEINGCIVFVLLRVQDISKKSKAIVAAAASQSAMETDVPGVEDGAEEEKDEYGMPEKFITSENKKFAALHRALHMESIIKKTRSISDKIQTLVRHQAQHTPLPQQRAAAEALVTMRLQELYPFIQQYLFLAQHHLFHFVQYHKTINKLTYVLCNTFSILFSKGFCIPEMEQEMKEGEEENNVAGTGIGDGEGGKDVSDEIEDEEQVLGTQNDKKQDEDDKKETEEEDKGIEMENDFEGNMEDVEPTSDQDDEDDDEDDEEKEDPDEAIGDVDDDNPEAIDEKMWGDDEAEDARDNDKMIDEDKSTEQNEQESDMVAKDEEDSGKQDDKKKKKKEEKKDQGKDDQAEAQEGGDDEKNDQEAQEDEDAEEEEFEDHNDEESAEHKPDDQQQVEIPEAETLDLPDDLNLDGDEKEGEDGQDDEGPEEEPFQDQMDTEEQPSKDKKQDGEDDEEDEDDEKDGEGQETASGEKVDDEEMDGPEDEDTEMAEPPVTGDEEKEGEEKEEEEDDEESRDDSRQRPNEEARAKMDEKKEEDEEEEEDEDDVKASEQEEQPDQDADAKQEFGVEGEQGKANSSENPKAEDDSQRSMETAPTSSKSDPTMEDQQDQQSKPQDRGDDSQKESRPSNEEDKDKPKKRETNPHRSLAEALKNWKQKLQDLTDPEEEDEEDKEQTKDEDVKEGDEMEVDENQAFEYLQNDDEAHDMETMGNANEQQMQDRNKDLAAIDEEQLKDDPKEEQVADMDVDPQDEDVDMDQGPEDQKPQVDEDAMEQTKPENAAGAFFSQRMDKRKKDEDEDESEERDLKEDAAPAGDAHEPLKPEEVEALRQQLEVSLGDWRSTGRDPKEAQALWQKYDNLTQDLALGLCEQLRLILEPTQATKLKGDYRTGKRLNMKKIIPYIASQFKKDKIWLRRTKPSKRQYQVMIAIDDSTSMSESHSVQLAYESLALISKALSQLEVGELGIMSFGERVDLLHPFDQPFTGDAGAKVLQRFGFDQHKTKVKEMMEASIALLQHAKMNQSGPRSQELWQLQIIISDGICESHETRQAAEQQIMLIFIILDNKPEKESIMKMTTAKFTSVNGMPKLALNPYLETFPFDYYVVLQNINSLPETLADALRQYFSFVASSFMEVSNVVLDDYRDYSGDDSDNDSFNTEEMRHGRRPSQDQGHKFVVGWNKQWHLGKDRNDNNSKDGAKVVATDQASAEAQDDKERLGSDLLKEYQDGKQWIWLTNVWHGLLRQYRRPLDHVLANNNATPWELMYTHRFPGPITHTSLSKRVLPRRTRRDGHFTENAEDAQSRISIRLAVVFKVVQDEHIAYHSRVYHFGVFHGHQELGECSLTSKDTCHARDAFVSFDYVLPGSTPIKDFSLDYDTILYSRLSDSSHFRTLKLPRLKAGSTSFERPFALSYGVPGPSILCGEKRHIPYRMSYLTSVPSGPDSNLQVLMGQVRETRDFWTYRTDIAYETTDTDIMTGNKHWKMEEQWTIPHQSPTQDTNMIDDEQQQYGVPVQKPFFVKSADGSSISIPVKNAIRSYEAMRVPHPVVAIRGEEYAEDGPEGHPDHHPTSESWDRLYVQDGHRVSETLPVSSWEHKWSESTIPLGSVESVDTDLGVVNDAADMMVLRTTRNEILIMKRAVQTTDEGWRRVTPWELSMAMDTGGIITGVLAMKIVSVPVLPPKGSEGDTAYPWAKDDYPVDHKDLGEDEPQTSSTGPSEPLPPMTRNILLIVYGSGNIRGFDMDHPQESSSFEEFLREKFAVVIGMLAVVVAFVINEAR
ncbi:hypothetical protein BGZ70_006143 [Mortierella alpina]|uniref:VWFA domain-containing protein n=1 Tax=Mortierella alpina TaxID=64518 RepID=A0A9P6JER2_MORAP|nr:hypothetical protein BGZ70_006143 [Mortierella alpina]